MRGLRVLFIGAAVLCVTALAQARLPWGGSYWVYTYKSFDVVADGSSGYAEKLARNMERFDIAFAQVTKMQLGEWRPVTRIYALDAEVIKLVWPNSTLLQSGYRVGEFASDIVIDNNGEGDNVYRGAYFGYAGILLSSQGQHYPSWYTQGIDQLFASSQVRESDVTIGSYSEAEVRSLVKNPWIPMREVLRMKSEDPQLKRPDVQYQYQSECWLLVHLMMIEGTRHDEMYAYLQALSDGVPEERAFAENFKGRYEDLDNDMRSFIFRGRLNTEIVKIPRDTDKISPVKITEAQANGRLAELTIRNRFDVDYGLKLAAESLAAEPGDEIALRAQAAGQLAKGQFADSYRTVQALYALSPLSAASHNEAARIYAAIARAVDNHHADVGVEGPKLWAQAKDAYQVAISLDANDLQALSGFEDLLLAQKDRDGIRAFLPQAEKAFYHNPRYGWLARNVSIMHSHLGDIDDAVVFAQAWKRAAYSASDRDAADAYLTQLRAAKARRDAAGTPPAPAQ